MMEQTQYEIRFCHCEEYPSGDIKCPGCGYDVSLLRDEPYHYQGEHWHLDCIARFALDCCWVADVDMVARLAEYRAKNNAIREESG